MSESTMKKAGPSDTLPLAPLQFSVFALGHDFIRAGKAQERAGL
jgi:hypothetical protein